MKMTALQELHKSMIGVGVDIQQFQITLGIANFDCLFSIRETPFVLALTSRGGTPKFFKFDVLAGYKINDYFGDQYGDLLEVLKGKIPGGERLRPGPFFEQLNTLLPTRAYENRVPSTADIIRLRPDITEDRDRPYFDTWIFWVDEKYKNVPSPENLAKTQALIGCEAAKYSVKMRASSKWSVDDLNRNWNDK